jgi:hypothetical protein
VLGALGLVASLIIARPDVGDSSPTSSPAKLRVAPLFIHGDGRGSFGCMVVNPPVFLSEDEARQVIRDEARKAGIEFGEEAPLLEGVSVPITDRNGVYNQHCSCSSSREPPMPEGPATQSRDVVLDGYDAARHIAFEVVSRDDLDSWEVQTNWHSSVSSYPFLKAAEYLKLGLSRVEGEAVVAVFYDPSGHPPASEQLEMGSTDEQRKSYYETRERAGRAVAEQELRDQVRNFLQWLKTEGII